MELYTYLHFGLLRAWGEMPASRVIGAFLFMTDPTMSAGKLYKASPNQLHIKTRKCLLELYILHLKAFEKKEGA